MSVCVARQIHGSYGELFVYALRKFGILCVGVYRFRDVACTVEQNPCAKRYVITNPPDDFRLLPTDKVLGFHLLFSLVCVQFVCKYINSCGQL